MKIKPDPKSVSNLISLLFSDPKYFGKHVIVVGGKIYVASTGDQAAKIFEEQSKKHPGETPLATYVPENNALIL